MAAYLWYAKSGDLCEGFISSWTLLLAHEGSHAVQPERSHRHETPSLGNQPITALTAYTDSLFGVKMLHT